MTKKGMYVASIAIIFIILAACHDKKTRILIIGDSISIGYTPFVKAHFSDRIIVSHNPGNAQHTGTGLDKIEGWLGNERWDIIQFNWGLWDLCYRNVDGKAGNRDKENGKITYNRDAYASNLDAIAAVLKKRTNAKLIFVTTTYVPENEPGRFKDDPIKYNDVAKRIMKKHAIEVNDIYEPSRAIHDKYGKGPDDVHYTKEGYEKLGELVVNFLEKKLKELHKN